MRPIFRSGARDTEASRIAFGRDGLLYMSISAPGSPDVKRAQNSSDYAGKVIRLYDDGSIPPDNPFARYPAAKPGIYTLGHRNGHGLAVNPETGEVWESEQGPNGGDEVNVLKPGGNYGWPVVSFGRDYWGKEVSSEPTRKGMEDPKLVWIPSIAITGMTFYTGDRFPHWKRNLIVAGLREGGIPGTGQLQRVVFSDEWDELRREPLLTELKQRLRDVRQGPDGLLYVLTPKRMVRSCGSSRSKLSEHRASQFAHVIDAQIGRGVGERLGLKPPVAATGQHPGVARRQDIDRTVADHHRAIAGRAALGHKRIDSARMWLLFDEAVAAVDAEEVLVERQAFDQGHAKAHRLVGEDGKGDAGIVQLVERLSHARIERAARVPGKSSRPARPIDEALRNSRIAE
jgi:hypothetical protein